MLVVTGTFLVLLTWAVCVAACVLVGLPLALLTSSGPVAFADLRRGMWWGFLCITVFAYLANLVAPLASAAVLVALVALVVLTGLVGAVMVRRRGWAGDAHASPGWIVVAVAGSAAAIYLAVAALGRVTNYDSGLYHLGAVRYAAQYSTIPGLANLYFPLGYGNAEFPLAGLLQNGPWSSEGFRLLNGLVIGMLVLDLVSRSRSRRCAVGWYVAAVGTVTLLVPMVALSDYWVTSPSQDSIVFAVTVAVTASLADAVLRGRAWVAEAAVASALCVLLVLLRPTMLAFALALFVMVIALRMRAGKSGSDRFWLAAVLVTVVGFVAGTAATLRDYFLSGWLQYPLSIHPFDVPWRAADPAAERIATLGYHRDPTDLWNAAHGWSWIRPWLLRLTSQWETAVILALILTLLIVLSIALSAGTSVRIRSLILSLVPSVVMTVCWFTVTPPSFRFAWGPVFTCLTIPLGWTLWRLALARGTRRNSWTTVTVIGFAVPTLAVVGLCALTRLQPSLNTEVRQWQAGVSIPYSVAPVKAVLTQQVHVAGGLVVQVPIDGEQCWQAWPLCTPRPTPSLHLRGKDLADGFLP